MMGLVPMTGMESEVVRVGMMYDGLSGVFCPF